MENTVEKPVILRVSKQMTQLQCVKTEKFRIRNTVDFCEVLCHYSHRNSEQIMEFFKADFDKSSKVRK
jgi:hypothetical protein